MPSFPTSLASGDCHLQHTEDGDDFSDANGDECGDEDAAGGEYEYYFGPPLHERRDSFCEPLLDDRFGMNERGAHFWPTAMFTGGVFGSQHSQHSQQPYSGQYSQQREVGLQQPAVPAAVGSSFFGLHYSEQPCSGQQPTVVTAEVVGSFPGQHSEQRFAHFDFGQQPLHEQEVYNDLRLPQSLPSGHTAYNDLRLPQSPHEQGAYDGYDGLQGLPHEQEAHNSPLGQHDQYSDQPCSGQQQRW